MAAHRRSSPEVLLYALNGGWQWLGVALCLLSLAPRLAPWISLAPLMFERSNMVSTQAPYSTAAVVGASAVEYAAQHELVGDSDVTQRRRGGSACAPGMPIPSECDPHLVPAHVGQRRRS